MNTRRGLRRLPDTPAEMIAPRLPTFPGNMVINTPEAAPVPPAPVPQDGIASDYEARTIDVDLGRIQNAMISIYKTTRRWRACDVYLEMPSGFNGGASYIFSVFVFAISQSGRSLVTTGRMLYDLGTDTFGTLKFPTASQWVAAARASAERYEIVLQMRRTFSGSADTGTMKVTVACCDEMTDPPEDLGTFSVAGGGSGPIKFNAVQLNAPPMLEVVGVVGVNTAAGNERYLLLFDSNAISNAQIATVTPKYVWGLGSSPGQCASTFMIRQRSKDNQATQTPSAPILCISSNASVYTPTSDSLMTLKVR